MKYFNLLPVIFVAFAIAYLHSMDLDMEMSAGEKPARPLRLPTIYKLPEMVVQTGYSEEDGAPTLPENQHPFLAVLRAVLSEFCMSPKAKDAIFAKTEFYLDDFSKKSLKSRRNFGSGDLRGDLLKTFCVQ